MSVAKYLPAKAGNTREKGLIPMSGRSPGEGVEMTSVTCLTPHGDDLTLLGLVHMAGLLSSHDVGSHVV